MDPVQQGIIILALLPSLFKSLSPSFLLPEMSLPRNEPSASGSVFWETQERLPSRRVSQIILHLRKWPSSTQLLSLPSSKSLLSLQVRKGARTSGIHRIDSFLLYSEPTPSLNKCWSTHLFEDFTSLLNHPVGSVTEILCPTLPNLG